MLRNLVVAACFWGVAGTAVLAQAPDPASQLLKAPIAPSLHGGTFSIAAVGDLLGPGRPITPLKDPEFEKVVALLHSVNIAIANNEGAIFDLKTFDGAAAALNGGGDPLDDPETAADFKAMGLTILSKANNHAFDFGMQGLDATDKAIEDAGLLHVGSGANLAQARAPVMIETAKGRVTVLATASTFNPASPAAPPYADMKGRGGISVLRTTKIVLVTAEEMTQLRQMAAAHGVKLRGDERQFLLFGQQYRIADKPGLTYEMDPSDESDILRNVRGAKEISDFTLFTTHAHETANGEADDEKPGDFLPVFYHHLVDAGADMVITHGQHVLRGIEIYKGRPIFYSLGSFFDDLELDRAPSEYQTLIRLGLSPDKITYSEYLNSRFHRGVNSGLESMIAIADFERDRLKQIRLYPLTLNRPGHMLGTPALAPAAQARRILEDLARMSAPYGTHIEIENSVGFIRLPPPGGTD